MTSVESLAVEFEKIRPALRSFILRMTASVTETEDLVQDTYIKAHEKLQSFREESSLKTWLFSIGANLTKDHLRSRKLWPETVTDICRKATLSDPEFLGNLMRVRTTSPQGNFEISEHITFCFTCIGKSLPLEQQLTLLLKEVYEFKVTEIATILDKTEAMVKYYLHTGRSKMIEIFDSRCALINKEGACHQCSELNGIFNPKQKMQEEAMKIEMHRESQKGLKDRERLFDLRMKIVRGIDPFNSPASELQLLHLQHNKEVMDDYLEKD
ncbi:MAG TPA: RNA polymerase sigma factor [Cyclobacteriaceae bacterium]|nr:RNA polymerase sigma factor [Cyclobacteriaceae bacterium]